MKVTVTKNAPAKSYEKKWQFCVGSCHAATLLRTDTLKILKRVHEELGIKRVRCHGCFNDDMATVVNFPQVFGIPVGEHVREFNFYRLGVMYDNILSLGMKPFVEMSFMPQLLAKNPERSFLYGTVPSLPKDWEEWKAYIRAYLAYLFHRYGEEEVCTWYFEVWNEPDLSDTFFSGGENSYMTLYENTARTIKEFCPRLQVGGPATSASRWIDRMVAYCREHDVPLDFVSTHQYIGDPFMGVSEEEANKTFEEKQAEQEEAAKKRAAYLQILKGKFEEMPADTSLLTALQTLFGGVEFTEQDYDVDIFPKNAATVRGQADGLPVFYTEWNMSANFGSPLQDSRKVAAYDVRASLAIEDLVEGDSIWCFSDLFEELHQFKEPFHGGYGLCNLNGIPKPVFYGMRMLAQAGDMRLLPEVSGSEGTEASAFESEEEKQVLLYRFVPKSKHSDAERVQVEVELEKAPARVTMQRLDETHGNPRKVWEEMGSPYDLNAAEVSQIEEASKVVDEELPFTWQDGVLRTAVELGENDVYFIRIVK